MGRAVVVMGVSGCGKSTVGAELARLLGAEFVDGDDLHPESNKTKMAAGIALTDQDRWPWLERVKETLAGGLADGPAAGRADGGVVVACSALRRAYRDRLREAGTGVRFVYLEVTEAEIQRRLRGRQGHFFPPELVASQFATLEAPRVEEEPDVIALGPKGSPQAQAAAAGEGLSGAQGDRQPPSPPNG